MTPRVITHLLDTSAILADYFHEPGWEQVHTLLVGPQEKIGICVVCLPELKTRLLETIPQRKEAERVFRIYADELTVNLATTRAVAEIAIQMRESVRPRLPALDSLIAACAKHHNAILVHRDPHMAAIPTDLVQQLVLPPRR